MCQEQVDANDCRQEIGKRLGDVVSLTISRTTSHLLMQFNWKVKTVFCLNNSWLWSDLQLRSLSPE